VVKWWDRFWGAAWMVGSAGAAYLTARWFAINATPSDLGGLRYGLIVFSGLFGLLVGAFCLSILVIGITTGVERLLARAGYPLRPPILPEEAGATAVREDEGDDIASAGQAVASGSD
jgi:hypothetical protein